MRFIYVIFVLIFLGCATSNKMKSDSQTLKVTNIEEFDELFGIDAINTKTNEEIFIVSYKQAHWDEGTIKKPILSSAITINVDNIYNFELKSIKPIVGKFEGLGAYIIVKNDTLKSAGNYKELPSSYISENSIGLLISN